MWVFGYGSLVWKVDFPYSKRVVGYIEGYARRFWQASIDHRGVPGKPGRVVTLVPSDDPKERVWGVAYYISPEDREKVTQHLDYREKDGYVRTPVQFFPSEADRDLQPFTLEFYLGSTSNPFFVGPDSLENMAKQIAMAIGPSGPNKEYLYNLAAAMKNLGAGVEDAHLFELEREVRKVEMAGTLAVEEVILTHITGSAASAIVMDMSNVSEQVLMMKA